MKLIEIILILVTTTLAGSCQQSTRKMEQTEILQKLIAAKKYTDTEKRIYYISIQSSFQYEVRLNDLLVTNQFGIEKVKFNDELNPCMLKSGKQKIELKLFFDEKKVEELWSKWDKKHTDYGYFQLKISYGKPGEKYTEDIPVVLNWELTKEEIETIKPGYQKTLEFDAILAYNYSQRLEGAADLRKIPDIGKKALNKLMEIRSLYEKGDVETYWGMTFDESDQMLNSLYKSQEEIAELLDFEVTEFDTKRKRTFLPIPDYEISFYAGGKIIHLTEKDTKEEVIRYTMIDKEWSEIFEKEVIETHRLNIQLYRPAGSNKLEIY